MDTSPSGDSDTGTTSDSAERSFDYRYPGSPPFTDTEQDRLVFKGRAKEADVILHSILASDLFVLFGISGMGKTSLLNAGVFHRLRERNLWPVVIRLNDPQKPPVELIDSAIRNAAALMKDITVMRDPALADAAEPENMWELLSGLEVWKGNKLQQPVLIFDPFEELFTLGWSDATRQQFIADFGDVARRYRTPQDADDGPAYRTPPPRVKIVLVIREDSLGELEALTVDVPQIMRQRFRLEGLGLKQAKKAIRQPALVRDPRFGSQRFTYSKDAAQTLITFLRTNERRGKTVLTATIEPSQLQVICQHIEQYILPGKQIPPNPDDLVEITADDLGGETGLNEILRDFYRRQIESFAPEEQDLVRRLCETGLISQNSRRLSLEQGEIQADFGVSKELLGELVSLRLLRADDRVGSVYYELAHDTLVEPILGYRRQLEEEQAARAREEELQKAAVAQEKLALEKVAESEERAARLRTTAIRTVVGLLVILLGVVGYLVATPDQQPTRDVRCAERSADPISGQVLDEPIKLKLDEPDVTVAFGRGRSPMRLQIEPAVSPGPVIENPINVRVGRFVSDENTQMPPRQIVVEGATVSNNGTILILQICIDPEAVLPGLYEGTIVVDDPRFTVLEVPVVVTLQSDFLFGPLLFALGAIGAIAGIFGLALHGESFGEWRRRENWTWLALAGFLGATVALLVSINTVVENPAWRGTVSELIPLFTAVLAFGYAASIMPVLMMRSFVRAAAEPPDPASVDVGDRES